MNQTSSDIAILNIEDEEVMESTKDIKATTKYFSSNKEINGCYLKDEFIYYYGDKVLDTNDMLIVGKHNIENVMASIMIAKELDISNGRKFYNDTEATNIKCTQIALSSFNKPIIIILGGLERGQNFNELNSYMDNVKCIIGIGQCRDRVLEYGKSINKPTYIYEHLSDGFDKCYEESNDGDIILLSPASASWDQYKECEVRGAEFKKKVEELKNED